ncbi:hypothetical protein B0T25DRAFT_466579 [Lasiosphaeria hispida]|uniref:Uncharacterized protein n=1 Tax=Lasiosphaeria hispida TaxID=260671 RepID=A0AAJ0H5D2_9PEZI|nr:hypothetical protein B0T25DRAFT_466579 [Lasiosphaeria hispida]
MPLTEYIQAVLSKATPILDKYWFFINSIRGEYNWLILACKKLVVRVFNRGDGLLWDLVKYVGL